MEMITDCAGLQVSVIIVNYNTRELLRECIDSILDKTHDLEYEIIVVDNQSADDSVEMLRKDYPQVRVIEAGGNLGFGRANNLGMKAASGEYLLLLNSDTILLNNALKEFYDKAEAMRRDGVRIGALGAVLTGKDGKSCHSYGRFITPGSEMKETAAKYLRFLKDPANTSPPRIQETLEVDYVTGADLFLPAYAFRQTGGFDPDFFMYCEEVDWQKRMADAGLGRYIIAGPEILHLEGGSEKGESTLWSPNRLANLYTSRRIYRKKHYGRLIHPFFRAAHFILDMPSIIGISLISRRKEYLRLIKLQ